jgi:hypothetical protein
VKGTAKGFGLARTTLTRHLAHRSRHAEARRGPDREATGSKATSARRPPTVTQARAEVASAVRALKTLVTQRMKNSGMRWSHLGARAILNPRGWVQSDRFDRAWALIAATYRSEVAILNNVIPFSRKAA